MSFEKLLMSLPGHTECACLPLCVDCQNRIYRSSSYDPLTVSLICTIECFGEIKLKSEIRFRIRQEPDINSYYSFDPNEPEARCVLVLDELIPNIYDTAHLSIVDECISSRTTRSDDMKSNFGKKEGEYSRLVSKSSNKLLNSLWETKRIPEDGWGEHTLDLFLSWLSSHDTNNRVDMCPIGAGEREGRVISPLVRRLHSNLTHGIGRSGNLTEIQPKALGSSMLACLANEFSLHAFHLIGLTSIKACLVVPLCTGMSLSLCMTSWRRKRPSAKYVVWLRIDQKSSLKSIFHAGFEPIIVEPVRDRDALVSNVESVNRILEQRADEILCVMTTTSCFAPRNPDNIEAIAALCATHKVPHLVNNAYGLQSEEVIRRIMAANECGRIDAVVQSLDKNFQVPVGGAVIACFKQSQIQQIAQAYPGRASSVPCRDLVLTLLYQGHVKFLEPFHRQKQMFHKMRRKLISFAENIGECVYDVQENEISLAMTLSTIPPNKQTLFGSILFSRGITGARVVASSSVKTTIEGCEFLNFGSHSEEQHGGYLNIACGVGMHENEVEELFCRLTSTYAKFIRQISNGSVNGRTNGRRASTFDLDND